MSARSVLPQALKSPSPFVLAPGKGSPKQGVRKSTIPKQSGSKSPPAIQTHSRKNSDFPATQAATSGLTQKLKSAKGSPRSSSPKSPFSDLNQMLEFLSKKAEAQKSPYRIQKPRKSTSPKAGVSPKSRSPKTHSPRPSFAFQSRVQMEVIEGQVRSPKLYDNQIFRDVFDAEGQHDKELYSSFADSSLEVYQEHQGAGTVTLVPRSSAPSKGKVLWTEKPDDSHKGPDTTKIEEGRQTTPSTANPDFGEELWRKLARLQEVRSDSQSETACEEVRDSRK